MTNIQTLELNVDSNIVDFSQSYNFNDGKWHYIAVGFLNDFAQPNKCQFTFIVNDNIYTQLGVLTQPFKFKGTDFIVGSNVNTFEIALKELKIFTTLRTHHDLIYYKYTA